MSYEKLEVTRGLMEAYTSMHDHQNEVSDQPEDLQEAPKLSSIFDVKSPQAKKSFAAGVQQQMDKTFQAGGGSKSLLGGGGFAGTYSRGLQRQGLKPSGSSAGRSASGSGAPAARSGASGAAPTTPRASSVGTPKVAPTKPAGAQTGDKAKDMATWAKANPTLAAKVKPGQSGYAEIQKSRAASGGSAAGPAAAKMDTSKVTKTAFSSSTPALAKPLSSAAATAATTKSVDTTTPAQSKVAAAPKPVTMGSKKPGSAFEEVEVDVFDLVLEYLISEGHAETTSEAEYIMTNLDAEMIENIVEAKYGTKEGRHKLAMKIKKGEEVGKSGPGTGFKAVEKQAAKYGATNPKAVAAAAMWKTHGK